MRFLILSAFALSACAATPVQVQPAPAADVTTTIFVVRHAEKASDGDDPPLTEQGLARAEALAVLMVDEPLVAVYSTPFQRTQQTVAAAATGHGLGVTDYDPRSDLPVLILDQHAGAVVLVAGHSNTVPSIVAGLGAPEQPEIPHEHYGDLYRVTRVGDDVELVIERYGD